MPQKGKSKSNLGKSLKRDRFKGKDRRIATDDSLRHTTEVGDGYDWNKINLRSVTEETSIDEFLNTAQLAGTEFVAEKLNITFVNPKGQIGVLSAEERREIEHLQRENQALLQIPRRPSWDATTSAAALHAAEEEAFLSWRRQLSLLQEARGLTLTPYERNLAFWRQLWRVVERSDVVVQILDARNPLMYRCDDLERYVREVDPEKDNLLLINKSDFLTESQRAAWADWFNENGVKAAFFSALNEADPPPPEEMEDIEEEEEDSEEDEEDSSEEEGPLPGLAQWPEYTPSPTEGTPERSSGEVSEASSVPVRVSFEEDDGGGGDDGGDTGEESAAQGDPAGGGTGAPPEVTAPPSETVSSPPRETVSSLPSAAAPAGFTSPRLLSRDELIDLLKTVHTGRRKAAAHATVGFVGYPNVGKSSTINALLQAKKTSVSATPGKTKHFQTLHIDPELVLCDCPGLVMPSFLSSKAEMVIWGVLPIDQMRDHVAPVNQVAHLLPRRVLETTYSLKLPEPREGEEPNRPPTSEELLNTYGYMRSFMTARGMPDRPRSARIVLKDFVRGKLLYCVAPPSVEQGQFHTWPLEALRARPADQPPAQVDHTRLVKPALPSAATVESRFFHQIQSQSHSRDVHGVSRTEGIKEVKEVPTQAGDDAASEVSSSSKPWRQKGNSKRPKKGKLRRMYRHLDDV